MVKVKLIVVKISDLNKDEDNRDECDLMRTVVGGRVGGYCKSPGHDGSCWFNE